MEDAAIGGHPDARFNLAIEEGRNGRIDWAVKHFIIAASLGCDSSMQTLKRGYAEGEASKEDFVVALRALP